MDKMDGSKSACCVSPRSVCALQWLLSFSLCLPGICKFDELLHIDLLDLLEYR